MMRKLFLASFFAVVFLGSVSSHAEAAMLYFDPSEANLFRGDTASIKLRLDTDEDECVNTVDAVIHYDQSIRAVDVSTGDSILSVWVEAPIIDAENRTIRFAAGVPGGYCGRIPGDPSLTNEVVKIVLRSPGFSIGGGDASLGARVWLDESTQVLLHDGYGTPAPLRLGDAVITLEDTAGPAVEDEWKEEVRGDTELPSDFAITLTRNETAFSGKYFIVFNASDKQSGIDHYEVMEEPFSEWSAFKWGAADAPWTRTESPHVLADQTLNSTIRVKAIDKAGNARIVTLVPDTALRSISSDTLIALVVAGGVVILILVLLAYALWKRKQRLLMADADTNT